MNPEEPLSATTSPWVRIARRITLAWAGNPPMSTPAFSRSRSPIGGSDEPACPAWWRAGHREAAWLRSTVTRMAWSTRPLATSS